MKRRQLLLWALTLALWYVLFGFFIAPRLLKAVVLWQLPKQIGRPVTLQNVRLNPFAISVALQGFGIIENDADGTAFVGWDEVYVNVDPTGLLKKEIVFSAINISNAFVRVQLNRDGSFNFSDILARFPSDPDAPQETSEPPVVRVGQLRITGSKAVYADFTHATPFHTTLGPIDVLLRDFSTTPRQHAPYAFTATTEAGETFAWRGRLHLSPIRSDGEFAVENVDLKKYAPFYDDFLNLTLRSGTFAIAGSYRVEFTDQLSLAQLSNTTIRLDSLDVAEPGQTNSVMALGNLTIAGVDLDLLAQTVVIASLRTSGDRLAIYKLADGVPNVAKMLKPLSDNSGTGVPPVSAPQISRKMGGTPVPLATPKPWRFTLREIRSEDHRGTLRGFFGNEISTYERVQLTNLRIVTEPLSLTVDEILVVEPRLDVHLPADATNLFAKSTSAGTNAAPDKPLPFASVGAFVVSNATVTFTDETVQPTAGLTVTAITARVTGFTTDTNGLTEVALAGRIDNTAPFTVTGHFNPFSIDASTVLQVALKNINLVPAGPYSGKYAGYLIRKGNVSIDLNYDIQQRVLKASNTVLLDQFTFGETVDSPSATKLPVKLAVGILKDRHGQIKLDVPIEGRLDDPQFRYWPAVWGVLGNMFTKIFTAPFSMLGSMFGGGGEELSYQEFAPGSAVLQSNETKKLDVLIKALNERPALNLEITGSIDPVKDIEPLKREKLRALAIARSANTNDYAAGLRILYAEALPQLTPAAPPRITSNVSNIGVKSTTPTSGTQAKRLAGATAIEEMERQYLPLVELTPADYRQLTSARVATVATYLKETGPIAADRLFISTNPNTPVAKDGARAIFGLQ